MKIVGGEWDQDGWRGLKVVEGDSDEDSWRKMGWRWLKGDGIKTV
jgi:hypothetical protein